jgi:3-oxoacyl-[acyl-carrier protein] reductase
MTAFSLRRAKALVQTVRLALARLARTSLSAFYKAFKSSMAGWVRERNTTNRLFSDAPMNTKTEELFGLTGLAAIVTGGAVNIGRAVAKRLAEAGAGVAVAYHESPAPAEELAGWINDSKGRGLAVRADVRDESSVERLFATALDFFGRVDILVNNAGIFSVSDQAQLSSDAFDQVISTNLKGAFLCTRAFIRGFAPNGQGGSIINVASINGLHPGFGQTAHYDASKGGLIAYTRSLAVELAPIGIRVNAVAPGLMDSESLRKNAPDLALRVSGRTPLGRLGQAEDVANAVLFLASRASAWITGHCLVVDGGYLLT